MHKRDHRPIFNLFLLVVLILAISQIWAIPVSAQCGSSTSSCKECHEIQKEDPINNKGAWHKDHAFGDFCESCHAGNPNATDKTAAHQGMVSPMADVQASCQSCHAKDYKKLAEPYAKTLNINLNKPAQPTNTTGTTVSQPAKAVTVKIPNVALPKGSQVIDLSQLYALDKGTPPVAPKPPLPWGNILLSLAIVLLAILGFAFILLNERLIPKAIRLWHGDGQAKTLPPLPGEDAPPAALIAYLESRPEVRGLLNTLENYDPVVPKTLTYLLQDKRLSLLLLNALTNSDAMANLTSEEQLALRRLLAQKEG